jgi:LCP family protein required for cell wall assembly
MRSAFKRTTAPKLYTLLLSFVAVMLAFFILKGVATGISAMQKSGMTPANVIALVFDTGANLAPINGRVNVLLLGIGGGNHDGADLTDTILLLSFNLDHKTLGMISVPRDIWSDTLKDKVNSAYHYGEEKKNGGGLILSKAVISDMVGLPIQYGIVFDFTKFEQIINIVGGVTIDVPEGFTDAQYPIAGKENDTCNGDATLACRYETLTFAAGLQTMDGSRSLKYVRSRHAFGSEGNDFARGRRQQQVLVALKNKLTSSDIMFNPQKGMALLHAFDDATATDMNTAQLLTVGKLFMRTSEAKITRLAIDDLLYSPDESWYGRFVLLPKDSFEAIHTYVTTSLK